MYNSDRNQSVYFQDRVRQKTTPFGFQAETGTSASVAKDASHISSPLYRRVLGRSPLELRVHRLKAAGPATSTSRRTCTWPSRRTSSSPSSYRPSTSAPRNSRKRSPRRRSPRASAICAKRTRGRLHYSLRNWRSKKTDDKLGEMVYPNRIKYFL